MFASGCLAAAMVARLQFLFSRFALVLRADVAVSLLRFFSFALGVGSSRECGGFASSLFVSRLVLGMLVGAAVSCLRLVVRPECVIQRPLF